MNNTSTIQPKKINKRSVLGNIAKQPQPGVALDQTAIARLLRVHKGNVAKVADSMGANRNAVFANLRRNPELMAIKDEARERFLDQLEGSTWDKALAGDNLLSMFLLKTIGRHRGYDQDERHQVQEVARAAFEFVINKSKNPAEPGVSGKVDPRQIDLSYSNVNNILEA